MADWGSMPRSSRSNTCSASSGGLRNETPLYDTSVAMLQKFPSVACPGAPGGCVPGHSTVPSCVAITAAADGGAVYVNDCAVVAGLAMTLIGSIATTRQ